MASWPSAEAGRDHRRGSTSSIERRRRGFLLRSSARKLMKQWLHDGVVRNPPTSLAVIFLAEAITLGMGLLIGLFHAFRDQSSSRGSRRSSPPWRRCRVPLRLGLDPGRESGRSTSASPGSGSWADHPWATFATFAVVATAASVMMGATVLGRHLFALGVNEAAARLSGLKIRQVSRRSAYGLSGDSWPPWPGILFAGRGGQASPQLGISYEFCSRSRPPSSAGAAWPGASGRSRGPSSARGPAPDPDPRDRAGSSGRSTSSSGKSARRHRAQTARRSRGLVLGTVIILRRRHDQQIPACSERPGAEARRDHLSNPRRSVFSRPTSIRTTGACGPWPPR